MPLTLVIRIALRALARHRLRSVLSMLGMSIGVGAFICSIAVGQGASQQIEEQIRSLGENFQIPSDFVVKSQAIDITDVI
jgi:putative ABC transport system permease protein